MTKMILNLITVMITYCSLYFMLVLCVVWFWFIWDFFFLLFVFILFVFGLSPSLFLWFLLILVLFCSLAYVKALFVWRCVKISKLQPS